jgi:hypothetical protein
MTELNFKNADYYFKSQLKISNLDILRKTEQFSLGKKIDSDRFIPEHDIYHFLVDAGLLHLLYRQRTNQDFRPEVVSNSFHGEALIELLGRFFGNFEPQLRTIEINNHIEKCLVLPEKQIGLRPGKGREGRFFLFDNVTCLNLDTQEKQLCSSINFEAELNKFIEFIILASLLNGEIADKYISHLQERGIIYSKGVKHFVQIEFRQQIRELLQSNQISEELADLDTFLYQMYQTSLDMTIKYCKQVVNFVQECFLNPKFDTIYQQGNDLLIPFEGDSGNKLLALFFYINKSANLIHDNDFKLTWQLNKENPDTFDNLITYYALCLIK